MSNKLTETNNCGVKFFFPCIFKFTKYLFITQIFVYLSCATSTGVESMEINGIKHILIHIKNIEYYKNKEKGIQKYFFTLNTEKYKTPFAINVTALSDKFDVIMQSIIRNWEKFK